MTERMTVTLPADLVANVRATVAAGEYASTSDIVHEALRDWSHARDDERRALQALREVVRVGDESGPSIPADEVFGDVRRLLMERRATKA